MRASFLLLFTLLFFSAFAQDANDLPERKGFKLTIPVSKTSEYVDTIKASPYIVHADIIQIYPGESIFVEVEEADGKIKSMKTVKENKNPGRTISISFSQTTEDHVNKGMMLKVSNPFTKELKYSAKMFVMGSNKWHDTDVFPVQAGLLGFESWPDVIVTIALFDWKISQ